MSDSDGDADQTLRGSWKQWARHAPSFPWETLCARPCWAFLLLKWCISSCVARVFHALCSCIIIIIIVNVIIIIIYREYKFDNMGYRVQRKQLDQRWRKTYWKVRLPFVPLGARRLLRTESGILQNRNFKKGIGRNVGEREQRRQRGRNTRGRKPETGEQSSRMACV